MLTTVSYITENFNNQFWNFEDCSGQDFEDYIYTILAKELEPYYKDDLRIVKTSRTRDDGIDIYIESPIEFLLMGNKFSLNGKKNIEIVIECKSTNYNKIAFDKFAKNIITNNELELDYFILATNGTIVPSAFYKAITEFKKVNCKFYLFDQYFLLQFLINSVYKIKGNVTYIPHACQLQLQYQIRKGRIEGRNCFELYFDVKNYSNKPTNIKINLISNRNWNIEEKLNEKLVPAHQGICLRFLVKRIYNDGIDDFKLNVTYNNQSQLLNIKNPEVIPDFLPPLTGSQHKKIINDIYNDLLCLATSQFYYIYGEAGIGKTRIIDEIVKKVFDTNYAISHILCNKRNKVSLKKALYKELKIINSDNKESSWDDLTTLFDKNKYSKYLVIIEDLHNSSDDFYEELKDLVLSIKKYPCAFIIAGREDDTVYNEAFFSCANWLKNNSKRFHIERLSKNDCELFIKSVIKDIPSLVLERLTKVSKGNPFFIVQFIEYLLEIDFATLLNRSTVGMTNVNTFSSHKYIPEKIENLIQKRQEKLMQLREGQRYTDFLRILCLFGITAPKEIIEEYWGSEENEGSIDLLFRKHYLTYDDNGDIRFDHETLFLFFNKELENSRNIIRISQIIIKKFKGILIYLTSFQKAKVYFYAKNYLRSEQLFSPIMNDIDNIKNISSTNLSSEYFEYLDEIYQLAKRKANGMLQEKIIQSSVYIPMHNMDYGTTITSINKALEKINKNHSENNKLKNTILQLRAHTELTAANLKQAEQLFLELLAEERIDSNQFSLESRFDLFDRTASLYTRYNHKALAEKYNILSEEIANELDDSKLISLSKMMKAKINYYSDTQLSIEYMEQARKIMTYDNAYRINCHNNVSIVGANVMLATNKRDFSKYIKDAKELLTEAIDNNYSFTIIRCNLLLAALYYLSEDNSNIAISKQYINDGINASVRYGCEKLMNYFYNLKAVISIREGLLAEYTLKYFDTMLDFLVKQNLIFLGNLDFCYGNIISITNYAKFIYSYGDEQRLYHFLNKLSYYKSNQTCDFDCSKRKDCYYSCNKNIDIFKKNIRRIEDKKLILLDEKFQYPLYDDHTGYYIVIH
ncbi:ATP-binding protein [Lachnospiraceae bacterium 48-21]